MMKHLYQVAMVCMFGLAAFSSNAQLANPWYHVETIVHNNGDYGEAGHDLSGYVTYRLYAQFANNDNYLTAIFASEVLPDCVQDADTSCSFNFPCGLFQHEFGDVFGFNEVCLYPAIIPTSEYDSFITIGQECSSQVTTDFIGYLGLCNDWQADFEGPNDANYFDGGTTFFWDEGAVFAAPSFSGYPTSLSAADPDNRVLIGQFTTCGDMDGCINIQYIDQNGNAQTALDLCFEAEFPCNNVIDITPDITLADCFGEDAVVELDQSDNGAVDYYLYSDADLLIDTYTGLPGLTITGIDPGSYYVAMQDEVGCRDTTEIFAITEPDELLFDAELLTDVLCFGQTSGSIEVTCSGGTPPLTVTGNNQQYNCGAIIQNLGCGSYTFTVTDDNGCQESETIQVSCPDEIEYSPAVTVIECYGDDNGSIVGDVTGGTGSLSVSWNLNNGFFEDFDGAAPLDISLTALDEGVYDVSIVDENGCLLSDSFEITEPDEYSAVATTTDATCFSFCDGTVTYEVTGGTAPFDFAGIEIGGGNVNLTALCAGDFEITITDDNNCEIIDTITIAEPTDILYTLTTIPVTCFGECDAEIQLTNVEGSFGNFTYQITPDAANCQAPCSGSEATYTDVCAGSYDIVITDEQGCIKEVNDIILDSPDPIEIVLIPENITCFGYDNGQVLVDVIGGTAPVTITPSDSLTPYVFTDLAPGLYSFTVTDANGCTDDGDVTIEQPPLLVASLIDTVDASCGGSCDGQVNYLPEGGTPPYEFNLLPTGAIGVADGNIGSLCAGDYQMVLLDLFNCFDTMEFTINEPDPLVIDVVLDAPTCTGMFDGSAEISLSGGTGELTFFIEPEEVDFLIIDSVTYTLSGLGEGEVYFELEDSIGCRLLDTLQIVPDIITDMVITMFSTPETCWNTNDGTATAAVQNGFPPISFQWDDPENQVTATASGLSPSQEYTVIVTDDIGCTLTESVFVDPTEGCFFIATAITPNGDGVNDTWILGGLEYYPQAQINVFNRWGQLVYNSTGYGAQWDGTYQGQLLPIADYYFTIDYAADKEVIMGTVTIKY
jgi:gliding motility-associated-like protein